MHWILFKGWKNFIGTWYIETQVISIYGNAIIQEKAGYVHDEGVDYYMLIMCYWIIFWKAINLDFLCLFYPCLNAMFVRIFVMIFVTYFKGSIEWTYCLYWPFYNAGCVFMKYHNVHLSGFWFYVWKINRIPGILCINILHNILNIQV